MIAILCAAGEGKRLKPLTEESPKCLLNVGSKTIIELLLDNLSKVEIKDVLIVVGYKKEKVIDKIKNMHKGCKIQYIINPDYSKTNNMYSLWLAMNYMLKSNIKDDVLFFNADVVFDLGILKKIVDSNNPNAIAVSSETKEDSMEVIIKNNKIEKLGKGLKNDVSGDAIGIYKISNETTQKYLEIAGKLISEGQINISFVVPINLLSEEINFVPVYCRNLKCCEIDNLEDYKRALELFGN